MPLNFSGFVLVFSVDKVHVPGEKGAGYELTVGAMKGINSVIPWEMRVFVWTDEQRCICLPETKQMYLLEGRVIQMDGAWWVEAFRMYGVPMLTPLPPRITGTAEVVSVLHDEMIEVKAECYARSVSLEVVINVKFNGKQYGKLVSKAKRRLFSVYFRYYY
jgi:hypothetical protein